MSESMWFLFAGAAVTLLILNVFRVVRTERLAGLSARRRGSSQLVSSAKLVEGGRRRDVALALTESAFIYENDAMSNQLHRSWIRGVAYDSELSTGQRVGSGKVLTIRFFTRSLEFLLPWDVVRQWETVLPARSD